MAVRAGHGSGKTTTAAWATLWFALTREALGIDWKVVTTASAWRQLTHYLWPEIHKWALRINWSKVGRGDFIPKDELSTRRIGLKYGSAFPVASNRSDLIEGAHASQLLYIFDESKRLDISTPIPTPTGWTTMGDLTVGDMVLGECGKPTKVTYVSPIVRDRPCCRITFEDGAEVIADPGHLWAALSYRKRQIWGARHTNDPRYRREYARVRDWRGFWDKADVVETSDLLAQRYAVPTCYPLDLPEQELPIDPYTLGAWLGDGPSLHAAIASMDSEILERIASAGHELTQRTFLTHNKAQTYGIVRGGLHRALRLNGLFGNKHIPQIYLRASYAQRLELLRGLMDTDGTVMGGRARRDSRVSFTSVEKQLVDDVAELARTFGWKVAVSEFEAKIGDVSYGAAYIIRWSADVCPFHLRRKAEKWVAREAQASASTIRSIKSIESVPSVPTRCISVDSERHLYLCGEHFIPTHNSIPDPTWISAEGAMVSDHCFVGSTTAIGINPRFVSERWYVGEIIEAETVSGYRVSVTPNHPVLTPQGWVTFGDLKEGDSVVCCRDMQSLVMVIEPNTEQVPARIENIFATSNVLGLKPQVGLAAGNVSFPGDFDSQGSNCEINVVAPNSLLDNGCMSSLGEHFVELPFVHRSENSFGLSRDGAFFERFFCHAPAPLFHSPQRSALSNTFGVASCPQSVSLSNATSLDVVSHEKFAKAGTRNPVLPSQNLDRFSREIFFDRGSRIGRLPMRLNVSVSPDFYAIRSEIAAHRTGGDAELATKLHGVAPDNVFTDQILYLRRRQFSGHVYNLQTEPNWYVAAQNDSIGSHRAQVGGFVVHNSYWLAISTPGDPIGKFYDIHVRKEGTEDWHVRHVKMEEALAAGRLSEKWIEDRKREWGEKSSTFKNRVLGEFAEGEIDSLIPLSWIEAAFERWREWAKNFEKEKVALESDQLGVDVARGGGDMSVVAHRKGYAITLLQKYNFDDTMVLTGHVAPYLTISGTASAVVDVVGWGAGVYDRLSEQFGDRVHSFHPQGVPDMMDATGLWGFKDNYSAAWWNVRELLDPNNPRKLSEAVIIQPDDKLKEELVAVKWKATSSGKIEVQPKEKTKEAIGRSPDTADAVVMAYWLPAQHGIDFA